MGGTLTVTGNQAFFWGNANGSLQAKSLRINSHAGAIIHNAPGFESISVQDGGTLVGMDMQRAACNLEVENGGNFIAIGELALEGSEVRLGSAGCFTVCGSTTMAGCTVELEEGGSFSFHTGSLQVDKFCTVVNRGQLDLYGWLWEDRSLLGRVENYGTMNLGVRAELGDFINYGTLALTGGGNAASVTLTGSFENHGESTSNDDTGLYVDQGGSAAGVPEELLR